MKTVHRHRTFSPKSGYDSRNCALNQILLRSNRTRTVEFPNPEKTCTNCNLCTEACTIELGEGNTLFHLVDPDSRNRQLYRADA